MTRIDINDLKAKFKTGDIPDGNDFNDFIDSTYNLFQSIDENTLNIDNNGVLSVVGSDSIPLVHFEDITVDMPLSEYKEGITYSIYMSSGTNEKKQAWLDLVNSVLVANLPFDNTGFGIHAIRHDNDVFVDVKVHYLPTAQGDRGKNVGRIYRLYQGGEWQGWQVDLVEGTVTELVERFNFHTNKESSANDLGHVKIDEDTIRKDANGRIYAAHEERLRHLEVIPTHDKKYADFPMGMTVFTDYGYGTGGHGSHGWNTFFSSLDEFKMVTNYYAQYEVTTNKDAESITQEIKVYAYKGTGDDHYHRHIATASRKMLSTDSNWGVMSIELPILRGHGAPGNILGATGQLYVDFTNNEIYQCSQAANGVIDVWNKLIPKADGISIIQNEDGTLSIEPSLGGPCNEAPQEYFFIDPITPNVPAGMYPDGHSIFLKDFEPSSDNHWVTAFLAISPTVEEAKLINRVIKNEAAGYCAHYVEIYEGGSYRTTLVRFWRYGLEPLEDWSAFSQFDSKGEKGNKGDKGDKGDKGNTVNWLSGEDVPNEAIGEVGDYYIDRLTGNVYHKLELEDEETEWNYEGYSIIGSKGDQGEKGDAFTYADFTEEQLELLIGPPGENGADGENGLDGEDGRDGDSILIYRSYDSVADMEADTHPIPMPNNVLGLIANESDADHGKLYAIQYNMDTEEFEYRYILTLSNALAIKGEQGEKGEKGDKGDKGDPFTLVIDDLETDDSESALSANQGMILNEKIELHEDILATTDEFGHVKIGSGLVISNGVVSAPEKEAHLGAFSQITCVPNANYWAHTSDFNRGITNVVTGNNGYITLKAGKVYRITLDGRIEFDSTGSVSLAIYDRTSNSHIIGAYGQWHSNNQNAAWGYANSLDFMLKVPDTTPTRNYSIRCVSANGAPRFGNWSEFRVLVQEV